MIISAPTPPSQTSITPSATPIICANSRRSSTSTRSRGRSPCATSSSTPQRPCAKPGKRANTALQPGRVQGFVDRYWQAVQEGLAFHRALLSFDPAKSANKRKKQRPGHNLLIRLNTFKGETLRFLVDFDVPFTNNLAEQDLRMTKVKMKISGSFRTFEGARVFVRLRSIVSTARKQGCNILHALTSTPANLLQAIAA